MKFKTKNLARSYISNMYIELKISSL